MYLRDLEWPRSTARLELRPARLDDADAVWRWRRLPQVGEWLSWQPADADAHRRHMSGVLEDMLVVSSGGECVGTGKVAVEDGWAQQEVADGAVRSQAEVGWMLDPAV